MLPSGRPIGGSIPSWPAPGYSTKQVVTTVPSVGP